MPFDLHVCVCICRLTLEQKELCRSRLKLLSYLDRLATYEVQEHTEFFHNNTSKFATDEYI